MSPLYSNTLQVIRHYLSASVGDLIYGQCGTTGADATNTYAPFLWQADDYYNDAKYYLYVYAGTNIGKERRVTDWDLSAFLLTHLTVTAACDATSYIELHHIFTEDEYRKAINLAIESLQDHYLVPFIDETTIRLTSSEDNQGNTVYTWEYDLPTNMDYLHRVITEEGVSGKKLTGTVSAGDWTAGEQVEGGTSGATGEFAYDGTTYIRVRKVDGAFETGETATGQTSNETCAITAVEDEPAGGGRFLIQDVIDPRDWSIVKQYPDTTPVLKLHKDYLTINEDLYLRLEGQRRHPALAADTGICYLPLDWIVAKAITQLPLNKIQSNKLDNVLAQARVDSAIIPRNYPNPKARKVVE